MILFYTRQARGIFIDLTDDFVVEIEAAAPKEGHGAKRILQLIVSVRK